MPVTGVPPEGAVGFGANPYIYPPQDAIRTYPSPCAPRQVCKIDVYVGNSGAEDADVYVNLYYATWGINFGNWKRIGTRNLTVAAETEIPHETQNCASSFYPRRYGNRSCDQYMYDLIEGRCHTNDDSAKYRDGAQDMYQGSGYGYDYMRDHDAYFRNDGYGYGYGGHAPHGSEGYENVRCEEGNASSSSRFFHVFEDKAHVCLKAVAKPAEGTSNTNTTVRYVHVQVGLCVHMCAHMYMSIRFFDIFDDKVDACMHQSCCNA
jgi:hypothetical protein